MKIEVKPITMKAQTPTKIIYGYIKLEESHIDYCMKFERDSPVNPEDELQGWEHGITCFETTALKSKISGVEKYLTQDKQWGVYIAVTGFPEDMKFYFEDEENANNFRDKIKTWLLK